MVEIFKMLKKDYRPIRSKTERNLVCFVLKKLLHKHPIALRFSEDDIRPLNDQKNVIELAPPGIWQLLIIMSNPSFYIPETYTQGQWYCHPDDICRFVIEISHHNPRRSTSRGFYMGFPNLLTHIYKHYINTKTLREVKSHYNSDPNFYEQVIEPKLVYSCAFFENPDDSLQTAQNRKLDITFERLNIIPNDDTRILDIGCGWGSFIFHSAAKHKGNFDGISISSSQVNHAKKTKETLSKAIQKRMNFYCEDYKRYLDKTRNYYDGIVSIGMLEHVGKREYTIYFKEILRLLKPGHRAVIHTITRRQDGITNPWIDKYIFPGGYIPRISEVVKGIENSGLQLIACHRHLGENYQKTLICWQKNLLKNADICLKILQDNLLSTQDGEKHKFAIRKAFRIWLFYLTSIQSIFVPAEKSYDVTQFVVEKNTY